MCSHATQLKIKTITSLTEPPKSKTEPPPPNQKNKLKTEPKPPQKNNRNQTQTTPTTTQKTTKKQNAYCLQMLI